MTGRNLIRELQRAIGKRWVLHAPEDLLVYEYDATIDRSLPEAVVLPETTEEVAARSASRGSTGCRSLRVARGRGFPAGRSPARAASSSSRHA